MHKRMIILSLGILVTASGGAAALYSGALSPTATEKSPAIVETELVTAPIGNQVPDKFTSSIADGPVVSVSGLGQQTGMNSLDLEISNVRLGAQQSQNSTHAPVTGMKLAKVATADSFHITRPTVPTQQTVVSGQFSIAALSMPGQVKPKPRPQNTVVASNSATGLSPIAQVDAPTDLPSAPLVLASLQPLKSASATDISVRLTVSEASYRWPTGKRALDQSPFGLSCASAISARIEPGAMVVLEMNVPCHPNTSVKITHGRLKFTQRTNHIGKLTVKVPALEINAEFEAQVTQGPTLKVSATVPDLKSINRVAVLWSGRFDLDLDAFEFGASEGANGHVSASRPRSVNHAALYGGGYVNILGDGTMTDPAMAEIYTLPMTKDTNSGVIRLTLSAKGTVDACGIKAAVITVRSAGGTVIAANGMQFSLPACDATNRRIAVKNAVRDIHIAIK